MNWLVLADKLISVGFAYLLLFTGGWVVLTNPFLSTNSLIGLIMMGLCDCIIAAKATYYHK